MSTTVMDLIRIMSLDMFVIRPNMAKRGSSVYTHVVLEKEVIKEEGKETRTRMKCIAQFRREEDAEVFVRLKREQFVDLTIKSD